MEKLIAFTTIRSTLKLDAVNGRIVSFSFDGESVAKPADDLFTIGLRNLTGDLLIVHSGDFSEFRMESSAHNAVLTYSHHPLYPVLTCRVQLAVADDEFRWRFKISNGDEKTNALEWIDGPQIIVSGKLSGNGGEGYIFQSIWEGLLTDNPRLRAEKLGGAFKYKIMGFPNTGANGYYPGCAQMQYLAYYNDRAGLYFGAHDATHCTKAVEYESCDNDTVRFSLQTFCGQFEHPGYYETPFDYVLKGFSGDWHDAAEIYRKWAVTDPNLPPRLIDNSRLPEWFAESPVILLVPVRGDGDDKGDMSGNEFFPYINIMPHAERYAKEFDSTIMVLLMHWEGTAPWAPPYVWPPFGGKEALAKLRDALHRQKHLLGVYCSGTAWTQTSSIIDYSQEEKCDRENLRAEMSRGPKGEIDAFICCAPKGIGQRMGYDCCIDRKWTQDTVHDEIMKLADFGIDYSQYFDQNLGGSAHFCYSREHGHPNMPGSWQTEAMKRLGQRVEESLAKRGCKMLIGCEASAAQPYLKYMQFNDNRSVNCFWLGARPVPAYNYIFHEYINNFMGNQNGLGWALDLQKSPDNLLYRLALNFITGDMLSVMLKDKGDIHWCWVMKWQEPAPEQSSVRTLVRNLNYWRTHEGKPFLVYGRMLKPLFDIKTPPFFLPSKIAERDIKLESVLSSSWEDQQGSKAEFLVNFRRTPQDVIVKLCPRQSLLLKTMDGQTRKFSGDFVYNIQPLSAVMLMPENV